MTRMGKVVPESTPVAPSPVSIAKKTTGNMVAPNTSAVKKVYCTPKINFVGELLYLRVQMDKQSYGAYMYEHTYIIIL